MPDSELNIIMQARGDAEAAMKRLNKSIEQAGGTADKNRGHFGGLGSAIGGVAKMATGFFAAFAAMEAIKLPINLGKQALGIAMDYQSSMNMLKAVSNATADQMKDMGVLAKDLGKDMSLPATSATNAAKAMKELAKAGLSVNDVMGAAKGTLQLAAAASVDEARAAEITANALNAFNLAGTEATRIADLLAAAANASSAEIGDIADALQMSGAVFAAAGIPIEDLTAALGELANKGIKGSDAGTSLKQMMLAMQNPSKDARKSMNELGLSIYDATGKMKPFREIIDIVSKSVKNLTQEQRDQALANIFGSDAVRAANIVLAGGVEAFDKMKNAVTAQGAAAKLAAAQTEGLGGALEGLKSQLETIALEAAEPFVGVLEDIVRWAADEAPKAWAALRLGLGQVSNAIKGVANDDLRDLETRWHGTLKRMAADADENIPGIEENFHRLDTQLLATSHAVNQSSEDWQKALKDLEAANSGFSGTVTQIWRDASSMLGDIWTSTSGFAGQVWGQMVKDTIQSFTTMKDTVVTINQSMWEKSKAAWVEGLAGLVQLANGAIGLLVHPFQIAKEAITAYWTLQWDDLEDIGRRGAETLKTDVINILEGFARAAISVFAGMVLTIEGLFGGLWKRIIDGWQFVSNLLIGHSIIPDMVKSMIDWFDFGNAGITNKMNDLVKFFRDWGGVTLAEMEAWGQGIGGIPAWIVQQFVREFGRLPATIPEFDDFLNRRGWRDPESGQWRFPDAAQGAGKPGFALTALHKAGILTGFAKIGQEFANVLSATASAFEAAMQRIEGSIDASLLDRAANAASTILGNLQALGRTLGIEGTTALEQAAKLFGDMAKKATIVNQVKDLVRGFEALGLAIPEDLLYAIQDIASAIGGPFAEAIEKYLKLAPERKALADLQAFVAEFQLGQQLAAAVAGMLAAGLTIPQALLDMLRKVPRQAGGYLDQIIRQILGLPPSPGAVKDTSGDYTRRRSADTPFSTSVTFSGPIYVRNEEDIEILAYRIAGIIKEHR